MIKWLLVIGVIAAVYYFFIKKSTPLPSKTKKSPQKRFRRKTPWFHAKSAAFL